MGNMEPDPHSESRCSCHVQQRSIESHMKNLSTTENIDSENLSMTSITLKNRRVGEGQPESVGHPVDSCVKHLPSPHVIVSWRKCKRVSLFALRELQRLLGRSTLSE